MKRFRSVGIGILLCVIALSGSGQSASFSSYMNPVIPGDHSDCTLTKAGNDFYTTGSSFNPTPVIYHSTDLIHWEAIAQPVSAAWSSYGDSPAGGCWGGQLVFYNNKYWDFFGRGFVMYFVTANKPEGPWSAPTLMNCPSSVPGLGADNSIFIDDDGSWYLLVKNGQVNNWIVQLGSNGQPAGKVLDLTWLNPAPAYPYSWAEGPVMWKHNGYYYYSFAINTGGGQKVMRSSILTADSSAWTMLGDFFNENDPNKSQSLFQGPNHSSAPIVLGDSTSWVIHPVWRRYNNNEWFGQGRQGLVNQVDYDTSGRPIADYPVNLPKTAPLLPSSGIPWMVPKSDYFETTTLNPEWSFLGYTPLSSWSMTERPGWLRLGPRTSTANATNTVIKTDAEHNYSLLTRLEFTPSVPGDEAGIRIINGMQNLFVKLYSSVDSTGKPVICFSYDKTCYRAVNDLGSLVWLKMIRVNHMMSGYYSSNGIGWKQVGSQVDVSALDSYQSDYNGWSGNRQGLYVQNKAADFDFYIYRDAYSPILAECPANQYGTAPSAPVNGISVLDNIHNNDWALYAGVEFGEPNYRMLPDTMTFIASSGSVGGQVEIWLDSLDSGTKIGTCTIIPSGSWTTFRNLSARVDRVSGRHDVYVRFTGAGPAKLFQLKWFYFILEKAPVYLRSETVDSVTILVKLDKPVAALVQPLGLAITRNGSANIAITAAMLDASDSSEMLLTLASPIRYNDRLGIAYTSGNIRSADGLELMPFSDTIANSILAGIVSRMIIHNEARLYPNPCDHEISIDYEPGFNKLIIYDSQGKEVFEKAFDSPEKNVTQHLDLSSGVYMVKVVNERASILSKIIVR